MKNEFLKKILNKCEYLDGFDIRVGMLCEKVKSVSVVPVGKVSVIRSYSDGGRIIGEDFDIIIRLPLKDDNCDNFSLLKKISKWLSDLSERMEEFSYEDKGDFSPLGFKIISDARLLGDDIHSARYKITCRFDVFEQVR